MKSFQRDQMAGIYEPHIEPFNRLVDELRSDDEWMPYVAPVYGGTKARVLAIFRDPGPKTQVGSGSGMLCVENDDPSAERHFNFLREAGIESCGSPRPYVALLHGSARHCSAGPRRGPARP